jgi:ADP-ribosylglycohydrolase
MNKRMLLVDAEHQVGEVRIADGLRSMCLGERNYGGGGGTVWATPGESVEFSVTKGNYRGYFVGICQAIYPKRKSIGLIIVHGTTWGDFKSGNAIEIKAESIHRYFKARDDFDTSLRALAVKTEESVYDNQLFRDISVKEIEEACREELAEVSSRFLGVKAYGKSHNIFKAYTVFIQNLRESRSDLQRQPSKKVLRSARRVRELLGLEGKTMTESNSEILPMDLPPSHSAGYGAIVGALVGDAAGGVLEFLGRRPMRNDVDRALNMPGGGVFGLAPGQITDDGELTLSLLRALAERDGDYDQSLAARYYVDWANSEPFDIGMATSSALRVQGYQLNDPASVVSRAARQNNLESKANGALMRITPLAVASARVSEQQAIEWAMADARLTHPHMTCCATNAAYVLAIRHLMLNPGDSHGAVQTAQSYLVGQGSEAAEWMEEAIDGNLPPAHPQAGYVRLAFTYAFYHLARGSSLRSSLAETLLLGGDTDTNACIVGGLIGAYRGSNKLLASEASRKLIYPVLMCDPSLGQARPEVYQASSLVNWISRIQN